MRKVLIFLLTIAFMMSVLGCSKQQQSPIESCEIIEFKQPGVDYRTPNNFIINVYLNDTLELSGYTVLDSFDIVSPSRKETRFLTEPTKYRNQKGEVIRKFDGKMTFDELGEYRLMHKGAVLSCSAYRYEEYKFKVTYKAKVLNVPTLASLSGNKEDENVILLFAGETVNLRLLLTDAKGNIARNKSIGLSNLKTDKDGIVEIKINTYDVIKQFPYRIYGDLKYYLTDYVVFNQDGNLIESNFGEVDSDGHFIKVSPKNIPNKIEVLKENNKIYILSDSLNFLKDFVIADLDNLGANDFPLPHPKDPLVIYTKSMVSKDGGKTFVTYPDGLSFSVKAVDPNNPAIFYGWVRKEDSISGLYGLFRTDDYGLHFTKVADFEDIDSIAVDPGNSNTIYVGTPNSVLRSEDNGKKWKKILNDGSIVYINPYNPSNILVLGNVLYVSNDGGRRFMRLFAINGDTTGFTRLFAVSFTPESPNIIYGASNRGILKSEDNGTVWKLVSEIHSERIAVDPTDYKRIYITFNGKMFLSTDGGKTFTSFLPPWFKEGRDYVNSFSIDSNGGVYAVIDGIIFKKAKNGNWEILNPVLQKDSPQWKIVDNKIYIEANDAKSLNIFIKVINGRIVIYKVHY